jgi:hypothetical protein
MSSWLRIAVWQGCSCGPPLSWSRTSTPSRAMQLTRRTADIAAIIFVHGKGDILDMHRMLTRSEPSHLSSNVASRRISIQQRITATALAKPRNASRPLYLPNPRSNGPATRFWCRSDLDPETQDVTVVSRDRQGCLTDPRKQV